MSEIERVYIWTKVNLNWAALQIERRSKELQGALENERLLKADGDRKEELYGKETGWLL